MGMKFYFPKTPADTVWFGGHVYLQEIIYELDKGFVETHTIWLSGTFYERRRALIKRMKRQGVVFV